MIKPALLVTLISLFAVPSSAYAQHIGSFGISANPNNRNAYFTSADYTLNYDITGGGYYHDVFVGKKDSGNSDNFQSVYSSPPITLTLINGAKTTDGYYTYPDGRSYIGINAFGNSRLAVAGGSVHWTTSWEDSTSDFSGGNVQIAYGYGDSITNVTGDGLVERLYGYEESTINISGGLVSVYAYGYDRNTINVSGGATKSIYTVDDSIVNISGGTLEYAGISGRGRSTVSGGVLPNGLLLVSNIATTNFVGSDLSWAYVGYSYNFPYGLYTDHFQVSGTIGGVSNAIYDMYIYNFLGTGNDTPRQFAFNGVPVTVPEPGTFPLALIALSMIGVAITSRRKKQTYYSSLI